MKKHKKKIIATCVITVLPMLLGMLLWDKMPDMVATHWGNDNVANGWSSKTFAVFGLPAFLLAAQLISIFFLINDPKRSNIGPKLQNIVFWIIPVVSWVCCAFTYAVAIGLKVDIGMLGGILMGVLFIVLGNYMPKGKQSYSIGIKLPWTLNSTENWNKTTRLAGKLWIAGGVIFLLNIFLRIENLMPVVILMLVLTPVVYSFMLYKKGV